VILLLGGTSETAELAEFLADLGVPILVSTATDADLNVGEHRLIRRRCGRLDEVAMLDMVHNEQVKVIVNAAHPFAEELHRTIDRVAMKSAIPLFRYQRGKSDHPGRNTFYVDSHNEAAELAASFSRPILLTTGSRNLSPYVLAADRLGVPLAARILPHSDSVSACDDAGLSEECRIFERGPFSVEANRRLIQTRQIGVLVTKESGDRGGFPEKIAAGQLEDCQVVVIRRPEIKYLAAAVYSDVTTLIEKVREAL
jgi:precorrin-6A/cobalt-precorrin-6A reductase